MPALIDIRTRISDPALCALVDARLAAARLDIGEVRRITEAFLATPDTPAVQRAFALSTLSSALFANGDYRAAQHASDRWIELLADGDPQSQLTNARQLRAIAGLLADTPVQTIAASTPRVITTERDKANLIRASATINGDTMAAVLDTGANLSVVTASTAVRLKLRIIDGEGAIGSATRESVSARIGIADRMEFAGATLHNVAFLILEDSALTFPLPGGYTIDAIIGFPLFRALERVTFFQGGRFGWSPSEPDGKPQNLFVEGNDLYVAVDVSGDTVPLHLDTGAVASQLSAAIAQRHPTLFDGLERRARRTSGAGGSTVDQTVLLPRITAAIDGKPVCLATLDLAVPAPDQPPAKNLGTLGQDLLQAYSDYTIDFGTMRFETGAARNTSDNAKATPGSCV